MNLLELDKSKGPKGPTGGPGAPGKAGAPGGKKPGMEAPGLPKTLNPADVHSYYMSMADFHDKKSWTNKRIAGLKPLWSDDRTMHDDRHLFHKAMRDGFAQKALAVDLAAPMDGAPGFAGMKESLRESRSPERIQVSDRILTLEQFVEQYGDVPLQALRTGRIDRFTIIGEAFSGVEPTGALTAINQNKSGQSAKPLPMHSPFPSQVARAAINNKAAGKIASVPKIPSMPKSTSATEAVARGASVYDVLDYLTKY